MAFTIEQTVRYRALALLATHTGPGLTTPDIAQRLDTTTQQAGRALRQLRAAGLATSRPGRHHRDGRDPDTWTAT